MVSPNEPGVRVVLSGKMLFKSLVYSLGSSILNASLSRKSLFVLLWNDYCVEYFQEYHCIFQRHTTKNHGVAHSLTYMNVDGHAYACLG